MLRVSSVRDADRGFLDNQSVSESREMSLFFCFVSLFVFLLVLLASNLRSSSLGPSPPRARITGMCHHAQYSCIFNTLQMTPVVICKQKVFNTPLLKNE